MCPVMVKGTSDEATQQSELNELWYGGIQRPVTTTDDETFITVAPGIEEAHRRPKRRLLPGRPTISLFRQGRNEKFSNLTSACLVNEAARLGAVYVACMAVVTFYTESSKVWWWSMSTYYAILAICLSLVAFLWQYYCDDNKNRNYRYCQSIDRDQLPSAVPPSLFLTIRRRWYCYVVLIFYGCVLVPAMPWKEVFVGTTMTTTARGVTNMSVLNSSSENNRLYYFDYPTEDESSRGWDLAQIMIFLFAAYGLIMIPSTDSVNRDNYKIENQKHSRESSKKLPENYSDENMSKIVHAFSVVVTVVYLVLSVMVAANRYRPHHGGQHRDYYLNKILNDTNHGVRNQFRDDNISSMEPFTQLIIIILVFMSINAIGWIFRHVISRALKHTNKHDLVVHSYLRMEVRMANRKLNKLLWSIVPRRIISQLKRDVILEAFRAVCSCKSTGSHNSLITSPHLQMYLKDYENIAVGFIRLVGKLTDPVTALIMGRLDTIARRNHCRVVQIRPGGECFVFLTGLPLDEDYGQSLDNNMTIETSRFDNIKKNVAKCTVDAVVDAIKAVAKVSQETSCILYVLVGMDLGRVTTGMTGGSRCWQYDVWGPAVSIARKVMELSRQHQKQLEQECSSIRPRRLLTTRQFVVGVNSPVDKLTNENNDDHQQQQFIDENNCKIEEAMDTHGRSLHVSGFECYWLTPPAYKRQNQQQKPHQKHPIIAVTEGSLPSPPYQQTPSTNINAQTTVITEITDTTNITMSTPLVMHHRGQHRRTRREHEQMQRPHPPPRSINTIITTVPLSQQKEHHYWELDVFGDFHRRPEKVSDSKTQTTVDDKLVFFLQILPFSIDLCACITLAVVLVCIDTTMDGRHSIQIWTRFLTISAVIWMIITTIVVTTLRLGWISQCRSSLNTSILSNCNHDFLNYTDDLEDCIDTDSDCYDDKSCSSVAAKATGCFRIRSRSHQPSLWNLLCQCRCRRLPLSWFDSNCNFSVTNDDVESRLRPTTFRRPNNRYRQQQMKLLHMHQSENQSRDNQNQRLEPSKLLTSLPTIINWYEAISRSFLLILIIISFALPIMINLLMCELNNMIQQPQYIAVTCCFAFLTLIAGAFCHESKEILRIMKKIFVGLTIVLAALAVILIAAFVLDYVNMTYIHKHLSPCRRHNTNFLISEDAYQRRDQKHLYFNSDINETNQNYSEDSLLQRKKLELQQHAQRLQSADEKQYYIQQQQNKRYASVAITIVQVTTFSALVIALCKYARNVSQFLKKSTTKTRRLETRFRVIKSAHKRVLLATMPEHIATIVAKSVQRQQANDTQITTTAINMAGLRAAIAARQKNEPFNDLSSVVDLHKQQQQSNSTIVHQLTPLYTHQHRVVAIVYVAFDELSEPSLSSLVVNNNVEQLTQCRRTQQREVYRLLSDVFGDFDDLIEEPEFRGRVDHVATSGMGESYVLAVGLQRRKFDGINDTSNSYTISDIGQRKKSTCQMIDRNAYRHLGQKQLKTLQRIDENSSGKWPKKRLSYTYDNSTSSEEEESESRLNTSLELITQQEQDAVYAREVCTVALDFVKAMRGALRKRVAYNNANRNKRIEAFSAKLQPPLLRVGIDVGAVTITLSNNDTAGGRHLQLDVLGTAVRVASLMAGGPGTLGAFVHDQHRVINLERTRITDRVYSVMTSVSVPFINENLQQEQQYPRPRYSFDMGGTVEMSSGRDSDSRQTSSSKQMLINTWLVNEEFDEENVEPLPQQLLNSIRKPIQSEQVTHLQHEKKHLMQQELPSREFTNRRQEMLRREWHKRKLRQMRVNSVTISPTSSPKHESSSVPMDQYRAQYRVVRHGLDAENAQKMEPNTRENYKDGSEQKQQSLMSSSCPSTSAINTCSKIFQSDNFALMTVPSIIGTTPIATTTSEGNSSNILTTEKKHTVTTSTTSISSAGAPIMITAVTTNSITASGSITYDTGVKNGIYSFEKSNPKDDIVISNKNTSMTIAESFPNSRRSNPERKETIPRSRQHRPTIKHGDFSPKLGVRRTKSFVTNPVNRSFNISPVTLDEVQTQKSICHASIVNNDLKTEVEMVNVADNNDYRRKMGVKKTFNKNTESQKQRSIRRPNNLSLVRKITDPLTCHIKLMKNNNSNCYKESPMAPEASNTDSLWPKNQQVLVTATNTMELPNTCTASAYNTISSISSQSASTSSSENANDTTTSYNNYTTGNLSTEESENERATGLQYSMERNDFIPREDNYTSHEKNKKLRKDKNHVLTSNISTPLDYEPQQQVVRNQHLDQYLRRMPWSPPSTTVVSSPVRRSNSFRSPSAIVSPVISGTQSLNRRILHRESSGRRKQRHLYIRHQNNSANTNKRSGSTLPPSDTDEDVNRHVDSTASQYHFTREIQRLLDQQEDGLHEKRRYEHQTHHDQHVRQSTESPTLSQQQKRVSSKNSNCTTPTKPLRPLSVNATISPVNSDQHQFESAAAFEKRERLMAVTIEEQQAAVMRAIQKVRKKKPLVNEEQRKSEFSVESADAASDAPPSSALFWHADVDLHHHDFSDVATISDRNEEKCNKLENNERNEFKVRVPTDINVRTTILTEDEEDDDRELEMDDNLSTVNDAFLTDAEAAMSDLNSIMEGYTTDYTGGSRSRLASSVGSLSMCTTDDSFYGGDDSYYEDEFDDGQDFTNEWMDDLEQLLGPSQSSTGGGDIDTDDDGDVENVNSKMIHRL